MRFLACLRLLICVLPALAAASAEAAPPPATVQSAYFTTSDHVRLHYLEAGAEHAHVLVFVPGWTMPAWIWTPQIAFFARAYRVIAFDPRGQGASEIPAWGYNQTRRGQDIAELIARLHAGPVVVVGWSLGVLDSLAYLHMHGDAMLAGLVLVDNSVGEEPPPHPGPLHRHRRPPSRTVAMRWFVQGMFRRRPTSAYLNRLTAACLRMPEADARALLSYPVPRSYWREAIFSTDKPVLYVVRPGFAAQAANLQRDRPNTETALFRHAGHALFVDDPARFNRLVATFLAQRVWP
jgi:non-heme chloroperoxidase